MVAPAAHVRLRSHRPLILREGFRSYKGNLYKRFTVNKQKQRVRADFVCSAAQNAYGASRRRPRCLPYGGKGHFAPISPKAAAIASSLAHADGER